MAEAECDTGPSSSRFWSGFGCLAAILLGLTLTIAAPAAAQTRPPGSASPPVQATLPANVWRVEGHVTMPARIALPPAAELLVEWRETPDGRALAATRVTTAGRQVPIPFTLDVPASAIEGERDGFLRAAIILSNAPRFLSRATPIMLPVEPGKVAAREIRLASFRPLAFSSAFLCGGRRVVFGMEGDAPMLDIDGQRLALRQISTASGSGYVARNDDKTQFRSKGQAAILIWKGGIEQECRPVGEPRVNLDARGQEPGWSLALAPQRLVLRLPDGEIVTRPAVPRKLDDDTHVQDVETPQGRMTLTIVEKLCRDTMTGMPFPVAVRLRREGTGQILRGCGGHTSEILAGSWTVERIAGRPLVDRSRITLEFGPEQRLSGSGSCNRYFAGYSLTGETLTIGQAGSTQMACPEALMNQEQRFFQSLAKVRGLAITQEGALALRLEDGGTILARR